MFYKKQAAALAATIAALLFFSFAPAAQAKRLPTKQINLNTATLAQLEQLPDVGPAMARRILAFREKSGPFDRIQDLLAIRGIGQKRYEKIRPYVCVKPPRAKETGKGTASAKSAG